MPKQGPGIWLHYWCADTVANDPRWEGDWWIGDIPKDYRSKYNGECEPCGRPIHIGDHTQKVTVAARIVWTEEPTIETLRLRNKAGDIA